MNNKRISTIIALLLILILALSGCGKKDETVTTDTGTNTDITNTVIPDTADKADTAATVSASDKSATSAPAVSTSDKPDTSAPTVSTSDKPDTSAAPVTTEAVPEAEKTTADSCSDTVPEAGETVPEAGETVPAGAFELTGGTSAAATASPISADTPEAVGIAVSDSTSEDSGRGDSGETTPGYSPTEKISSEPDAAPESDYDYPAFSGIMTGSEKTLFAASAKKDTAPDVSFSVKEAPFGLDGGFYSDDAYEEAFYEDSTAACDGLEYCEPYIYDEPYYEPRQISAGLLTAGEWNDNENFDFIRNLITNGQDDDYAGYFRDWKLTPFSMFKVEVCLGDSLATVEDANGTPVDTVISGDPVANAVITVFDTAGNTLYTARTDSRGFAYIYYSLTDSQATPAYFNVSYAGQSENIEITNLNPDGSSHYAVILESKVDTAPTLDLMFVVDTTGSMGDEIQYLQAELSDVIKRVRDNNSGLGINLSVNFYRDMEDDYIVRSNPFSTDIDEQLGYLRKEYAYGGGDFEEAVELALIDAVENHQWSEDSTKILFLVLDAPPHNTSEIREKLANVLAEASAKGIRIVPVASSGIDKNTEFLLRTFAMVTGGTYTFLTNDSGIGGSHIEATVGSYVVEKLNDLLVRVINNYLNAEKAEPVPYTPVNPPIDNPNYPVYIDDGIIIYE